PTFFETVRRTNEKLRSIRAGEHVNLDGESLDIASIVAVSRYGAGAELDRSDDILERIETGVDLLGTRLRDGDLVYGVNTGFGGSADTRTSNLISLQRALVQHQNSGILTQTDIAGPIGGGGQDDFEITSNSMPTSWVRGLMLSRVNSVLRGHSAVSLKIIDSILTLLDQDLTPVIPLRGSISASGDLSPLSYVAAVLQGNPSMYVRTGKKRGNRIVPAPEALELAGLKPVVLAAKEGLGLLNGTAASASVASLALHETNNLALLSQALTVMGVEAMRGTAESFHPFISIARPHEGQTHASATMLSFLQGSQLAQGLVASELDNKISGLCQDRYALRTSPQWIGPLLEDLQLAYKQVTVELNSTTDNPLIDPNDNGTIHHGGNFQALSITSALEKARNALQHIGKILFAQATEMINPVTSRGLPPNLCADDPSLSFTCKGLDINMASYASELGWLNHPLGPNVQSAEMHNQAVNSLALIAGRATQQSVEVLSMMSAAYLFAACQALDLRVLLVRFLDAVAPEFAKLTLKFLVDACVAEGEATAVTGTMALAFSDIWNATTNMDLEDRCNKTAESISGQLINILTTVPTPAPSAESSSSATPVLNLASITAYRQSLSKALHTTYISIRSELFNDYLSITPSYLGRSSKALYTHVRKDLGVPFFRGLIEDPTDLSAAGYPVVEEELERERKSIGMWASVIYEAIRDGRV
ncbi:phenylalanine ammonia-lyase, partial [Rhizodiscina lignyota]